MTDPLDLIETRMHQLGKTVKRKQSSLEGQCPAHDDGNPSFGATYGTQRDVVLHCHTGCSSDDIMAALGLLWTDFGDQRQERTPDRIYDYVDATGRLSYQVLRSVGPDGKKKFVQRQPTATGEWQYNLQGLTRVPYHLDELVVALEHRRTVWIAEGEKDVDRLRVDGVVATCNSGGANGWKDEHDQWFNKADVIIVPDLDGPGEKHAADVRQRLEARGCTVRIKRPAAGKDAFDHFAAGFGIGDFIDEDGGAEAWPDPTPLINERTPAPFPVHVLPWWMRSHAASQAESIQAPIDLHCVLGLGALSVATLGRVKVSYPWDGWTQPCNLYLVAAVAPSVGKSPAKNAMFGPLEDHEQALMDEARKNRRLHQDVIDVAANKIAAHKKTMVKDESFTARGMLEDYNNELHDLESRMPPNGRIMADDATIEALGMVLAESGGSIGVVSAEGGLFDRLAGLYNDNGVNLDLYLEGWSGGKYTVDRVKRESISIPHANVAVVTTVQPITIDEIGAKKVFAARGLLARFLMSMPYCHVGYRDRKRKAKVDDAAAARYAVELTAIAVYYTENSATFELNDEACEVFADWDQLTEYRLQPDGDLVHLPEWVGKLRANVLRLSALLHVAHGRPGVHVGAESVLEAIELADYFMLHMLMIAERWGADELIAQALAVVTWLERKRLTEFTVRDLYRNNRRLFGAVEAAVPVLQLLTESGHIRPLFTGQITVGRGGAPSPRFAVNPAVAPVSPVSPGGGEKSSGTSGTKRGIITPYLSVSDDFPDPPPGDTGATGATGPESPHDPVEPALSPRVTMLPNGQPYDIDEPW